MTDLVMEKITGSPKTERMLYKNEVITATEEKRLREITGRLLQQEPIQYVLEEAWFCGLRFYVDPRVLIPRPETEELVEWIIASCKFPVQQLRILDVGTGSGCIAVSLKRRLRKAEVWACDSSASALEVAQKNAGTLGTDVQFQPLDFLDPQQRASLPVFDIIVSNPPYIPRREQAQLPENVRAFEPASALFVPDDDPLVFYQALADFGKTKLEKGGSIFCEIHESLGDDALQLFRKEGYTAELKKDMQQKDRMLRVSFPGKAAS